MQHDKVYPTIRITTKCTQECSHCCFECSPKKEDMMSIKTATLISKLLLDNNIIEEINVMGGEFFCNENWKKIIHILSSNITHTRLVTNGDWMEEPYKVINFLKKHKNIYLGLAKDKFHKNNFIEETIEDLKNNNILFFVEGVNEHGVVPIGKGKNYFSFFSSFGCYCMKPNKKYTTLMIDEYGNIFKCPFGIWFIDNIDNVNGNFHKILSDFNKEFDKLKVMTCGQCVRIWKGGKLNGF